MADLTVEGLFTVIKNLRQERSGLEQKLQEMKMKRENLERTVDAMKSKYSQANDTNAKMKETLKVAHHKVSQSQGQASNLKDKVDDRRQRLNKIEQEIAAEKQQDLDQIGQFEEAIDVISDQLVEARNNNTQRVLQGKISESEELYESNEISKKREQDECEELVNMLEDLKLQKEKDQAELSNCPVPAFEQKTANQLFNQHILAIEQRVEIFSARIQQLADEQQQLAEEQAHLQDKVSAIAED